MTIMTDDWVDSIQMCVRRLTHDGKGIGHRLVTMFMASANLPPRSLYMNVMSQCSFVNPSQDFDVH
jgi:hypothetical protein